LKYFTVSTVTTQLVQLVTVDLVGIINVFAKLMKIQQTSNFCKQRRTRPDYTHCMLTRMRLVIVWQCWIQRLMVGRFLYNVIGLSPVHSSNIIVTTSGLSF